VFIGQTGDTGFTGPRGDTGIPGGSTSTGSTGVTGAEGPAIPPYIYFNLGITGATEPNIITREMIKERKQLVDQYTLVKTQDILTTVVNYHVETIINQIIQILINNNTQTSHLHYLQVPPGKISENVIYDIPCLNYDSVKPQAIPLIISILQTRFVDSVISVDKKNTYITVDWAIPK
jgi:hypothetical protein